MNKRATTNTIHISLNFGPEEKIGRENITEFASAYMEKIRLSNLQYLVYKHHDAGHPQMHIVSKNIQIDGKGYPFITSDGINSTTQEKGWKLHLTYKKRKLM